MTMGEVDIFFVEDGCPLEWCSYIIAVSIYLQQNKGRESILYHEASDTSYNDSI